MVDRFLDRIVRELERKIGRWVADVHSHNL